MIQSDGITGIEGIGDEKLYNRYSVDKQDKGLCTLAAYVSTNINKLQLTLDNQE